MTYGEYQQYLADGGWQAMSTRNAQIELLRLNAEAQALHISELELRIEMLEEALEDDRFIQRVIGWLVLAVAALVLAMTGVP